MICRSGDDKVSKAVVTAIMRVCHKVIYVSPGPLQNMAAPLERDCLRDCAEVQALLTLAFYRHLQVDREV